MNRASFPAHCRAALYIRLSKEDEQAGPSQSVTNQRALLDAFVAQNHLRVQDVYVDDGWSGGSFDRPAFQRMLRDIEANKVDLVVTKDLSRLGRDYILTGHYLERYFPEHRVRYVSLLDGIDTGVDAAANDITPFRAILNDMYAKDISRKIKSVKRDKQQRGQFIGGKPVYGYRMHPAEKNRLAVDEDAASTVRRVFAMALAGASCRHIAETLNREGVPSPSVYAGRSQGRGLWSAERIRELLRNETYTGALVQRRSERVSYKSKKSRKLPKESWIVVPDTHPPLVDREAFQAVAALLDSRAHTRRRHYDFPLKGLLYCQECGHPLGVVNRPNAAGDDVLYLICRGYQKNTAACSCHAVRLDQVTDAVFAAIQAECAPLLQPDALLPAALCALRTPQTESAEDRLAARRSNLDARLDRLYADRLNGLLLEEDFTRLYGRLQAERNALMAAWKAENRPPPDPESQARTLVSAFLARMKTDRALLCALLSRAELSQDRELTLFFRFQKP